MTVEALEARVAHVEGIVGQMDARLTAIESRINQLDQRFNARIDSLDAKFDARFEALNEKIDRLFLWTVGLLVGTLGTAAAGIIATISLSN